MRWVAVDHHFDFRGRDVGDAPVQSQVHFRFVSDVVDEFVLAGMAGIFEAAADQPFIETLEPAESTAALEIDKLRMNHLFHRRVPPQPQITRLDLQDTHAAGRYDREAKSAVVHNNDIDALLFPSVEREFAHGPAAGLFEIQLPLGNFPRVCVNVVFDAGQRVAKRLGGLGGNKARASHGEKDDSKHGEKIVVGGRLGGDIDGHR